MVSDIRLDFKWDQIEPHITWFFQWRLEEDSSKKSIYWCKRIVRFHLHLVDIRKMTWSYPSSVAESPSGYSIPPFIYFVPPRTAVMLTTQSYHASESAQKNMPDVKITLSNIIIAEITPNQGGDWFVTNYKTAKQIRQTTVQAACYNTYCTSRSLRIETRKNQEPKTTMLS